MCPFLIGDKLGIREAISPKNQLKEDIAHFKGVKTFFFSQSDFRVLYHDLHTALFLGW